MVLVDLILKVLPLSLEKEDGMPVQCHQSMANRDVHCQKKKEKGTWLVDFLARKTNKAVENGSAVKKKIWKFAAQDYY